VAAVVLHAVRLFFVLPIFHSSHLTYIRSRPNILRNSWLVLVSISNHLLGMGVITKELLKLGIRNNVCRSLVTTAWRVRVLQVTVEGSSKCAE
jgi:hypothetical protein